jgi:hypothetical protein
MATEFITVVDPDNDTGTDYTNLTTFESSVQANLTISTTKVFSHGGEVGTLGTSLTGKTSGATGTLHVLTSGQILIISIGGTPFQSGEQVYSTIDTNYVVISDAGDSPIAVAECRASSGGADSFSAQLSWTGWTADATNYVIVRNHSSEPINGKWDTSRYRFAGDAVTSGVDGMRITGLDKIHFIGIQGEHMNTTANAQLMVYNDDSQLEVKWDSCVLRIDSGTNSNGMFTHSGLSATHAGKYIVVNCVFHSDYPNDNTQRARLFYDSGITSGNTMKALFYNNTMVGFYTIVENNTLCNLISLKNNVIYKPFIIVNTSDTNLSYTTNYTDITDTVPLGGGSDQQTFTFVDDQTATDAMIGDYHLSGSDTSDAVQGGTDLSSDSDYSFGIDVDSDDRGTGANQWDAGFDQITQSATLEQEGFRWRFDNGSESAAGWRENQDVDETGVDKNTNIRLRILLNSTGDFPTTQFKLQYKRTSEGASNWRDVKE